MEQEDKEKEIELIINFHEAVNNLSRVFSDKKMENKNEAVM